MNQDERDAIKQYLDRVWVHNKRCPICGNDDWVIDNIANLPVRAQAVFPVENRAYPLAPILCRICGYTFFINEKWATR